jgi:hypothetical protein
VRCVTQGLGSTYLKFEVLSLPVRLITQPIQIKAAYYSVATNHSRRAFACCSVQRCLSSERVQPALLGTFTLIIPLEARFSSGTL